MPTSFTFDSLNLNQCFRNTPPLTIQVDNLPKLPINWLTALENQCRHIKPDLEKNIFFKHVGSLAKYKLKTLLLKQLGLIYYRVSGSLDEHLGPLDNKSIFLLELIEDIQQCTPGFHIRVNKLINSFFRPRTLDQLLYLVRKSIVEEIATHLTQQVAEIYQVHVANRVCQIAKKQGLAIEANIQKDRYKSLLSGKCIRESLKNEFPKHYTVFKIPFLLTEQLQLILTQHRYTGPEETGYAVGPAEEMSNILLALLSKPVNATHDQRYPFFILDECDEFGEPMRIYDIDWHLVQQFILLRLIQDNYFTKEPIPTNLLEYAYFQALMPEKATLTLEIEFIKIYLKQQNYAGLIENLILIHDKFPDYWKKLITNSYITDNIKNFFEFLIDQSFNVSNTVEILNKLNHVYMLFFSQTKAFILSEIKPYKSELKYNFLFKSVRYRPEITRAFLDRILINHNFYPQFFQLLIEKNNKGYNLLMLGARYHAETIQFILDLLSQNIDYVEKKEILTLISAKSTDHMNLLSLAAFHQPNAIKSILDFIKKFPLIFKLEEISTLFLQKNKQSWNFLQLLIRYQSECYVDVCLGFIQEKLESSANKQWLRLFLNNSNKDFLNLAALSSFNVLNSILIFIDRHIDQLNNQLLQEFFLHTYENGCHCLHIAARYNSSNLLLILDFIQKHIDYFDTNSLSSLFLAQNDYGSHFIQLAIRYQTESIDGIFKFISQNIEFFNKKILKQLFLQQNLDGWNLLSNAFLHPNNTKIILDFINQHAQKFDPQTIHEIILQKNKYHYNCLHLSARFQPDSLKNILNFIAPRIELFVQSFNLLLQNKKNSVYQIAKLFQHKPEPNDLISISLKYQPESALILAKFLNRHETSFDLKSQIIKKFTSQAAKLEKNEHSHEPVGLLNTTLTQHHTRTYATSNNRMHLST